MPTTIKNCINYADIEYGGIIGTIHDDGPVNIVNCINIGKCKSGIYVDYGGSNEVKIMNCYNMGECNSGFVDNYSSGHRILNIKNSYNIGKVVNGFIGTFGNNNTLNMENCYNSGESQKAIIGKGVNSTVTINVLNTYYDASKITDNEVNLDGIVGLTEEEMRNQKTIADTGKTLVEILNEYVTKYNTEHKSDEDFIELSAWILDAETGYPILKNISE